MDAAGRIRAFVGGVDYAAGPFDRAAEAHRQAGSAWKPFVYLAAMEAGHTPDEMVVDEPVTVAVSLISRPKPEAELAGLVYSLTPRIAAERGPWYLKPVTLGVIVLAAVLVLNLIFR